MNDSQNINREPNLNSEEVHQFSKGWSVDLENHAEEPKGYSDAWNGRLYSENGTLSFVSIAGHKFVYNNPLILKYNGYYAFLDELIVFGKSTFELNNVEYEDQIITEIVVQNFDIISETNTITGVDFSGNFEENQTTIQVPVELDDPDDFTQNLTDVEDTNVIDPTYGGLFTTLTYMPSNPVICSVEDSGTPINNEDGVTDFIMSFKYNNDGLLVGKKLYVGNLNIPMDAVICTEGVDENQNYKRVYFTDYYNPSRVVNIKDPDLATRIPSYFNINISGTLLNPRIKSIQENGQLKVMTVFYVMKLFTSNGQSTDYSPLSQGVKIVKGIGENITGGDTSEITNKSVTIECYIPNHERFSEVQLVAIEYEAKDVPSSVKFVGRKQVNAVVEFNHQGTELEFTENITLADLYANSINWKYNSDFTTKNNKLICAALRNDPSFLSAKNMALDFSLSGFTESGETHDCLLNPEPLKYNLINNNFTESFFYVQRKLYRKIEIFGNSKVQFYNNLTGDYYELILNEIFYRYVDYTEIIGLFLLESQEDVDFNTKFPNLNIRLSSGNILLEPIDENIITDFYNYSLKFSTPQVIVDYDNDIEKKNLAWPVGDVAKEASLIYGGVSNGWYNGNGVKVTMHTVKEDVLSKNTDWMTGASKPLQIKEPSLSKFFMKGEVYRLSIAWFKNGNRLFTTVLGDLKIPDIGQKKRELDASGAVIVTNDVYSNWNVVGNNMQAEGIQLQFDVRINCELSKQVDAYQIVYVERTESNRTILAQGISSPLEKMSDFGSATSSDGWLSFESTMVNKWMLPNNGGPVYDYQGLLNYDLNPDMNEIYDANKVIVTNRRSFFFDAPDLIYDKVSSNFVETAKIEYIETIATDHDRHNILGGYNIETCGFDAGGDNNENTNGNPGCHAYSISGASSVNGPYPFEGAKFSQKIPSNLLAGDSKTRPFYVNTSVFANRLKRRTYTAFQNIIDPSYVYPIEKSSDAAEGEILSGYKFNSNFDYANHSLSLGNPGWYYCQSARRYDNREQTIFRVNNIAGGRKTVFIKTANNFFTPSNIAQSAFLIKSRVNFGDFGYRNNDVLYANDAYIVSNLKRDNIDSIYGGRTEAAYSSNEYIPLSDVLPVIKDRISSQIFYVEGDSYCTLYLRNKTCYNNSQTPYLVGMHWDNWPSTGGNAGARRYQYNKYNAWCYAVVLESTVEPRLANSEEFYLFSTSINFKYDELYNDAYLQENDLRKSIPVPYGFQDDPILNNIIAISNTKLSGDTVDAWTKFSVNEFYELDKNKGSVLNLVKEQDEVFSVQELQTSRVLVDEKTFITPDNGGSAIQVAQGDGSSISGHEVISDYGTSFRRAIIKNPYGFIFFDELKNEIIKIKTPLLVSNNLALEVRELFRNNKVLSVEGYYDEEFKETNLRFRTENDINFVISYNELLKVFNGKIEYNNDLYFVFQNKVITPYNNSLDLGELNRGEELNFFGESKNIKLKVISAPYYFETKINKGIGVVSNINYPLLKTTFITSLGQTREVPGTHHWYRIREGLHTVPAKNETDYDDLRGEWCSIEIEAQSINEKRIKFFSLINFFRKSYK